MRQKKTGGESEFHKWEGSQMVVECVYSFEIREKETLQTARNNCYNLRHLINLETQQAVVSYNKLHQAKASSSNSMVALQMIQKTEVP